MKVALVFPGSGSQYIGMGKRLIEKYEIAEEIFNTANRVLDFDLKKLCLEGRLSKLSQNKYLQPAILTISYIMYKVYIEKNNLQVVISLGHSLGEYTALVCSGVIEFEEALKIVHLRGVDIDNTEGAMTIVNGESLSYVKNLCKKFNGKGKQLYVSCCNSPQQYILSGHEDSIYEAENIMASEGVDFTVMYDSVPVHCPLMAKVAENLEVEIEKYTFNNSLYPIITNCTGDVCFEGKKFKDNLKKQLINPVLWSDSVKKMEEYSVDYCIEVGPKTVLRDLIKSQSNSMKVIALDDKSDLVEFQQEVASSKKNRSEEILVSCLRVAVSVKNLNRDISKKDYEEKVIKPYTWMKELRLTSENNNTEISKDNIEKALGYLRKILEIKKQPEEFIERKLKEVRGKSDE